MRALVRLALINGLDSTSEIPPERWYGSSAVPKDPPHPFAEIRLGGTTAGVGRVRRRRLEVWVHQDEGDYTQVDQWLSHVRDVLDALTHRSDEAGNEIMQCDWVSDSPDLFDDGYRTNCKMTAYDLVGKEA